MTQPNHEILPILVYTGAIANLTDRLCRIAQAPDQNEDARDAALALATQEQMGTRLHLDDVRNLQMDDDTRFAFNNTKEALATAETRLKAVKDATPHRTIHSIDPAAKAALNIIANAARIEHHAAQLRASPNDAVCVAHAEAAESTIADIHDDAAHFQSIDPTDPNVVAPGFLPLHTAAMSALQTALLALRSINHTRRHRANVSKSPRIAQLPGQEQIDRLIEEFRDSDQPLTINCARLGPTPLGQDPTLLPIIVFDHQLTIHCKVIAEAYQPGVPADLAHAHALSAAQYATNALQQGFIDQNEATTINRHAATILQAVNASIHDVSISALQQYIDDLHRSGISPTTIRQTIVAIADSQTELISYFLTVIKTPDQVTPAQAEAVVQAAVAAGVHPTTIAAIVETIDGDPDDLGVEYFEYERQHLNDMIAAADHAGIGDLATIRAANQAGFEAPDIFAALQDRGEPQPAQPAQPSYASPLLLPGHEAFR